jgi:hypothetical protein
MRVNVNLDRILEELAYGPHPDEQFVRLNKKVSLQCLVEGMGITLKCRGVDLIGLYSLINESFITTIRLS